MMNPPAALKPMEIKKFGLDVHEQEALEKWIGWIDAWRVYAKLSGLNDIQVTGIPKYSEKYKVMYLINNAGEAIAALYDSIKDPLNPDTLEEAIERITKFMQPSYSMHQARRMFRDTKWHEYDGVNKYYSKLVAASKIGCNFAPKELEGEIDKLEAEENDSSEN